MPTNPRQPQDPTPEELAPEELAFERELAQAMRRVQPPAHFADAILARAQTPAPTPKVLAFPGRPRWVPAALAAALLLGAGITGQTLHRQQQRQQAERQYILAMQVTQRALAHTRLNLAHAGVHLD